MNILLITSVIPYPLSEGGKVSQYAVIDYLKKDNFLTLVLIANNQLDLKNIEILKRLWPEVNIHTRNYHKTEF
ncbi:MAG: hypothetical protein EOP34_04495 [Rickettsiales bacterium]|nr:MAG: hypothetical protein EOP34_04495 [Rickettsiales bacterium]